MRWQDRVYGDVSIEDPGILDLIGCPTFQRLKGVTTGRSVGAGLPVQGRDAIRAQPGRFRPAAAGWERRAANRSRACCTTSRTPRFRTRSISSITSQEQDHHEQLKPLMLDRPDMAQALARLGYSPREFYDDSIYPLLEQPIPWLCADRLDYFLRDGWPAAL